MQENDTIWELLGRSPLQEPDGWFVARALARIRREEARRLTWRRVWSWAGPLTAAAVLTISVVVMPWRQQRSEQMAKNFEALNYLADNTSEDVWSDVPAL